MRNRNAAANVALTSIIALAAGMMPAAALAQASPADDSTSAKSGPSDDDKVTTDIVITGSRIARPNLDSVSPVTSLSAAELTQNGRVSTGDVLNDLPALANTFSQANSTRFLGTAGLNLLDLRNLGPQRTLVLVNGRRHVAADILNNAVSPDVNTIPTDLIERVDVVTGGDSAIYGSDALAGVVNFVLKDKFEGLQARVQGGVSQFGDAGNYYASVLGGKNFAGGRGNVAINLEYARQNDFYASYRNSLSHLNGFVGVDIDPAGSPNGSDGNPDGVFMRDIRSATIYSGGLVTFYSPNAACGQDNQKNAAGGIGRPYTCNFLFQSDGTLVAQTGTRVGLQAQPSPLPSTPTGVTTFTPGGSFIGGNGNTRREDKLVQILPQLDRYSANLVGHFEVSSAFVPFVEAKFVRTKSLGAGGNGPAFFTGSTLDGLWERPRLDNPFLSAQARDVITTQMIAGGADPESITGATRFALRKNLTELGVRSEAATRDTYRVVVGARGEIAPGWRYEVSGNYGEFDEKTKVLGNLNVQRFLLAMDSTRNAAGQIVCRGVPDPVFGGDIGGNPAVLADDIAKCVPINPFGDGNISQAAKNYVLQDTTSVGKITQLVASGFISGDTRSFFNLPGGPIGVAVGGEYRRETAFYQQDNLVSSGYTFYNAIPKFDPPSFEVKEAYAELRLPVLAKLPLIEELTASGAIRVANYKGATGTVTSYNGGIEYSPIGGVRFRANYSRAVRAPNLVDLYLPLGQNFGTVVDPCSAANLARGTQYRAANCAAAGRPEGYDFTYAQSLQLQTGGNPDLKAETSDSYTYGVVVQPKIMPGFALTIDYYNVRVNNVITSPTAQQLINSCYDGPTLNQQFCSLFQRAGAAGGPNGEIPFRILEGSLKQVSLNYAKYQVRGIDFDVSYNRNVGIGTVSTHLIWTHSLQQDQNLDPSQPNFSDRLLSEVGQPKDAFNWNVGFTSGPVSINYQLRYLSPMAVGFYEDTHSFQGRAPQNADSLDIPDYPSVTYHDIRVGLEVRKGSSFYFGIDNFTDTRPPLGSTGIGAGTGIYEPVGRRFYAGFSAKF